MSTLDLNWQKKITLKNGREVVLRYPQPKDIDSMLEFVNTMVVEDTFISLNKKMSYEEELDYLTANIKKLRQGKEIHIAAYEGTTYLGSVGIRAQDSRQMHVGDFGISLLKSVRGLGLGKQLAQEALMQAQTILQKKLLFLWYYEPNLPAKNLYETLGFKQCGHLPKAVYFKENYIDIILMYKDLL